jgi:hypothetical protein
VGSGQFEHGEEVCGVLFTARDDSSEVFDLVEEALDAFARTLPRPFPSGLAAGGRDFSGRNSLIRPIRIPWNPKPGQGGDGVTMAGTEIRTTGGAICLVSMRVRGWRIDQASPHRKC